MTTYKRIEKQLKKETINAIKNDKKYLKENNNLLSHYLTEKQYHKYTNKKMTLSEARQLSYKKIEKYYNNRLNNKIALLEKVSQAPLFNSLYISVEWKRNVTWGYNPHATVYDSTNYIETYGSASGCGYDKLSAAVSSALNENYSILKVLYDREETRLSKRNAQERRDFIGYGAGYGALPHFEGGVGQSSINGIFTKAGYKVTWNETKSSDFIIIEKVKQ